MRSLSITVISFLMLFTISCNKEEKKEDPKTDPTTPSDVAFTSKIEFASGDGLMITADHYHVNKSKPVIVLCHQANYSRGEYLEIADSLNRLGFNCLAIDQRSGNTVNGVANETKVRATTAGKGTDFIDAKQDIVAAIAWAKNYYSKNVILWGSSYSSSLALIIAKEDANVETVLSFSPGEYLSPINVQTTITGLNKPAFLTSSKSEAAGVTNFYNVISSTNKVQFIPTGNGVHGAKALWSSQTDKAEYWVAVKTFLGV